jgi:hypothetical protein
MRILITQFSDCEPVKARVAKRFQGAANPELIALLAFIDSAKGRLDAMRDVNANVHLEKRFVIDGRSVRVTAKTVNGVISRVWAKLFS